MEVPVLRKHHTRDFTVIPNALLRDQRLSCRERGLLVWMLSKPQEWNFSHKSLLAELPFDKKGTVQACISKLEETGYLRIVQERKQGKLGKTQWYVYDVPYPEIPDSGKPASYKRKNIKKEKAVPGFGAGEQPLGTVYFDTESGEWRRKA